jgi:UDP-N-acetylmuramoylalanine--D-glutamate ligase
MLEDLDNHHSYISIFLNIYKDHLDWHLNFENYFNAKKNILKNSENILV